MEPVVEVGVEGKVAEKESGDPKLRCIQGGCVCRFSLYPLAYLFKLEFEGVPAVVES